MALRARTNSGMPVGSKPMNLLMVVSVIMMPAALMPKSSPLWIRPGMPSMMMRWPFGGHDVEDDVPAFAGTRSWSSCCGR